MTWGNWTEAEDAIVRCEFGRLSDEQIAMKLGRTCNAVRLRRRSIGLVKPRGCDWDARRANAGVAEAEEDVVRPDPPRGYRTAELEWAGQHMLHNPEAMAMAAIMLDPAAVGAAK